MILNETDVNTIFRTAHSGLSNPSLAEHIDALRPRHPDLMDWRFELRGALNALEAAGQATRSASLDVQELLFGKPAPGKRVGRDRRFSVEVNALTPQRDTRELCFDVAAMNATDAYVQLAKRLVYRAIPDVFEVRVYDGLDKDRRDNQPPARVFKRDDLIFVKADEQKS